MVKSKGRAVIFSCNLDQYAILCLLTARVRALLYYYGLLYNTDT